MKNLKTLSNSFTPTLCFYMLPNHRGLLRSALVGLTTRPYNWK
jgi:hypothetical protein